MGAGGGNAQPQGEPTGPGSIQQPPSEELALSTRLTGVEGRLEELSNQLDVRRQLEEYRLEVSSRNQEVVAQASMVISYFQSFLAVLTVMVAVSVALGYWDRAKTKKKQKAIEGEMQEALERAKTAEADVNAHAANVKEMYVFAWEEIDHHVQQLPKIESGFIVGEEPPEVPSEIRQAFEDADHILLICSHFRTYGKGKNDHNRESAAYFSRLASYWRTIAAFRRAAARLERARKLDPEDINLQRALGKTLAYWAASCRSDPHRATELLAQAKQHLEDVQRSEPIPTLKTQYELAWLADEQGDYDASVRFLNRAKELLTSEEPEIQGKAIGSIGYNLACSLTKLGRYEEALEELGKVAHLLENWRAAATDEDLQPLATNRKTRKKFQAILDLGRSCAQGTASA